MNPPCDETANSRRTPLRVLFFEDDRDDIELILRELADTEFEVVWDAAVTLEEFKERISSASYDVVLSDYKMPGITGMECFASLKTLGLGIPFILTTGSLGDEKAVECLKEGVADYVLKDRLARLPVAIHRALQERRLRVDQAEAVAALKRSEAGYRSLIQSAPCGILRVSAGDGRLLEANAALSEMLGYGSPADLLEHSAGGGIALDPHLLLGTAKASELGSQKVGTQIEWKRKDGTPLVIALRGRYHHGHGDAPACFELIAENITERRRSEERIVQLNRLYSVLSQAGQAIVRIRESEALCREICRVIVQEGHFPLAWVGMLDGDSFRTVAGWGIRQESGEGVDPVPVCGRIIHGPVCTAIRENQHILCEDMIVDPWIEGCGDCSLCRSHRAMAVFPLVVNERAMGAISIYAPLPSYFDRENVELLDKLALNLGSALSGIASEQLRDRAVGELNQFFALSLDMLCIANMQGYIYRLNHAWEKTLGYTLDEIRSKPWVEFVHPDDRPKALEAMAGFSQGIAIDRLELRFVSRDRSHRWLMGSAIPLADRGIVFSVMKDVTESRDLSDQLQNKNLELEEQNHRIQAHSRMKSEFLANMSHELRSPLNGIIGFTELLYDGKLGALTERARDLLSRVHKSAQHLLQLINGVLDLSKVEAGRLEVRMELVQLSSVVKEVTANLASLAAGKSIRLETDLTSDVDQIISDPDRLKQILYNYLSNALKFTGENGLVTVRTSAAGDAEVQLAVSDSGIGIEAKDIHRLFSEFVQLDSTAAKHYQGTGLGLALTKRIAEALGGRVGVESYPSRGSTFFVVLPRKNPRHHAPASILVVEDGKLDSFVLTTMLQQAGFLVESATTCSEAIARCERSDFDAITLDLMLPDGSGYDVLAAIRSLRRHRETPVIVVSAKEQKDPGLSHDFQGYLTKPVHPDALAKVLEGLGIGEKSEVTA